MSRQLVGISNPPPWLDPYTNPAADRPMVLTATGYVPIEANAGGNGTGAHGQEQEVKTGARSVDASLVKAAADDPKHPGWPAGTPGGRGGQFRPKDADEGGSAGDYSDRSGNAPAASPGLTDSASSLALQGPQYAALETGTQTDAADVRPAGQSNSAVQYAAATGLFWVTQNYLIDKTSATLLLLLTQVVDRVGPPGDLSPSQYSTKIHTEFAAAVKAEGLPGVEVEQSFGPDPDGQYARRAAKGSIRTDVILRDPTGTIIAIYDVKTGGAQLEPWRVRQLRAKTGTTLDTYVFEIHPDRGVLLKYRRGGVKFGQLPAIQRRG